jgi:transcriptional regulator with XRE-family HTH domain
MKTPLRLAREKREQTILEVATAISLDAGNLSRIERGKQVASREVAERLAKHFDHEVTEIQILYPERYLKPEGSAA